MLSQKRYGALLLATIFIFSSLHFRKDYSSRLLASQKGLILAWSDLLKVAL